MQPDLGTLNTEEPAALHISELPAALHAAYKAPGPLQSTKLSEKEQRELDYKIQVYELAKKRQDQEAAIRNREEYRMPDSYDDAGEVKQDERMKLLTKRFECAACTRAHPSSPSHLFQQPREWTNRFCKAPADPLFILLCKKLCCHGGMQLRLGFVRRWQAD